MAEAPPLPDGVTLQVWRTGPAQPVLVFQSSSKWLHPLFELTGHLEARPEGDTGALVLRDRIVGRAAAFLILGLGIRRVWADLASRRAGSLFRGQGLVLQASAWVDRIDCQTEDLLAPVQDFTEARRILEERRRLSRKGG